MAACGQSVYCKATANGVDRGTVEFTGDGHAAGESSVEFTHRAHVVRLPHDEHPLSCTCGRPDCSGEPCKHVPPLFSILAKAGTLEVSTKYCLLGSCVVPSCFKWPTVCDCLHQVSELELFHPLYHSATLRRLYVDIMRGGGRGGNDLHSGLRQGRLASPTVAAGACDHVPEEGKSSYFTCYLVVVTICCSHARQHVLFGCASPAES